MHFIYQSLVPFQLAWAWYWTYTNNVSVSTLSLWSTSVRLCSKRDSRFFRTHAKCLRCWSWCWGTCVTPWCQDWRRHEPRMRILFLQSLALSHLRRPWMTWGFCIGHMQMVRLMCRCPRCLCGHLAGLGNIGAQQLSFGVVVVRSLLVIC